MTDSYVVTSIPPTTDVIPNPSTTVGVPPTGALPQTGGDPTILVVASLMLVVAGFIFLLLALLKRSVR